MKARWEIFFNREKGDEIKVWKVRDTANHDKVFHVANVDVRGVTCCTGKSRREDGSPVWVMLASGELSLYEDGGFLYATITPGGGT